MRRARGMAQGIECWPSKHKDLNTAKRRRRRRGRGGEGKGIRKGRLG
jgi:hypothetical protein